MSDTTTDTNTQAPILAPMANGSAYIYIALYIFIAIVLIKCFKLKY